MCNSVQGLISIVGKAAGDYDRKLLLEADRRAAEFLVGDSGIIISDGSQHYKTFIELARTLDADAADKAERALDALDEATKGLWSVEAGDKKLDAPSDVACDIYTGQISAAFYFGLAVAFRLASGEVR